MATKKSEKKPAESVAKTQDNSVMAETKMIIVEQRESVGLITLNRPRYLNALNRQLANETLAALKAFDANDSIGAIVITGSPRAFAAGADIEEMAEKSFAEFYMDDFLAPWDEVKSISKPIIAAVAGYALGGGCELALLCDFIIASEDAQFGQPEIKLGVLPGIGGTQRLTRSVGKALAMDLVLTGRNIDAREAKEAGIVARIVPAKDLLQTTLEKAAQIAEPFHVAEPAPLHLLVAVTRLEDTHAALIFKKYRLSTKRIRTQALGLLTGVTREHGQIQSQIPAVHADSREPIPLAEPLRMLSSQLNREEVARVDQQSRPKARSLQVSSTNRMPALTKNEMRPTTAENRSAGICPAAFTASRMAMAELSA